MLTIRLTRRGKINQPFFRLVITDKRNSAKSGKFLEIVGFFNPLTKEKKFNKERIEHWLKMGAQPSDTAHNLLVKEGILQAEKKAVHKQPQKKTAEASAVKSEPAKTESAKPEMSAEEPAVQPAVDPVKSSTE